MAEGVPVGGTKGRIRYVPNPAAPREIEASLFMKVALESAAKMAAGRAKDFAPVDSGDYRDSIVGESVDVGGRWIGRVWAKDWKSGWIEFGTVREQAHATLRRGCEAVGLRVRGRMRYKWRPSSRGTWY